MSQLNIVLVDDNPLVLEAYGPLLRHMGHSVEARLSSLDAVEHFRREGDGVDLLITDLRMPDLDGLDLIRRLRDMAFHIPTIVITGFDEDERLRLLREEGAELLFKPVNLRDMAAAIERARTTAGDSSTRHA